MPNIDYPRVIAENEEQLGELEKHHRYSHLFHRVKMLRLLKRAGRVPLWEKPPRASDTVGASARGGSQPTDGMA